MGFIKKWKKKTEKAIEVEKLGQELKKHLRRSAKAWAESRDDSDESIARLYSSTNHAKQVIDKLLKTGNSPRAVSFIAAGISQKQPVMIQIHAINAVSKSGVPNAILHFAKAMKKGTNPPYLRDWLSEFAVKGIERGAKPHHTVQALRLVYPYLLKKSSNREDSREVISPLHHRTAGAAVLLAIRRPNVFTSERRAWAAIRKLEEKYGEGPTRVMASF